MRSKPGVLLFSLILSACGAGAGPETQRDTAGSAEATGATSAEARDFVARVNEGLEELGREQARVQWVNATYITDDTEWLAARNTEKTLEFNSANVEEAKRYIGLDLDDKTERAIKLIRLGSSMPAPNDAEARRELAEVAQRMSSTYAKGRYCPNGEDSCRNLDELSQVMAKSRDYDELLEAWQGWRTVSTPIRADYRRFVELTNAGAAELGFSDLGAMWRSGYDMSPEDFEAETERLWQQVKPLYDALHCHVRGELGRVYGEDKVAPDAPIPAHLLGNMWSQTWANVYDLLEPYPGEANLDVTAAMEKGGYTVERMFRQAEDFYTSLGLESLPDTFWEYSMLTRPRDREVACHPSAWPMDGDTDVRIKMCTQINEEDLQTIFHELGHVYYFLAYRDNPAIFHGGGHDGFHEAIGDTVVLSMTPKFLQEIGLVQNYRPNPRALVNQQLKMALDRIAFLPWGKLIDQWRWDVFSGRTAPENYNRDWWSLRTEYQGVAPPVSRDEDDFDPGAKYHVPGNTPYTRYFLSFILQFQFHRALCREAGFDGPLHECSVYGSSEAGQRLQAMLEMGLREPWPVALEKLTGTREMDATAIIEYFGPLMDWLGTQNEERQCGWTGA